MSKTINVNPDHYKVAGRERQGDAVIQNLERRQFAQQQNQTERWRARHEGPQPWEATAAPSVEEPKTRTRGAEKTRRRGRQKVARRGRQAATNRGRRKAPSRRVARATAKRSRTAARSRKRRRA